MFELLRIGYLEDDEVIAELNKHQLSDRLCRCYLCNEGRRILEQRGFSHDQIIKSLNLPASQDSGDI
jgi:hypothetical protein